MTPADLQRRLIRFVVIRARIEALEKDKGEAEESLLDAFANLGDTTTEWVTEDKETIKATVVRGQRVVYDPVGLEADLTPDQWEKVTKRVLDTELLEAAVAMKVVPLATVDKHAEVKYNKPFVKVSGKHNGTNMAKRTLPRVNVRPLKARIKRAQP